MIRRRDFSFAWRGCWFGLIAVHMMLGLNYLLNPPSVYEAPAYRIADELPVGIHGWGLVFLGLGLAMIPLRTLRFTMPAAVIFNCFWAVCFLLSVIYEPPTPPPSASRNAVVLYLFIAEIGAFLWVNVLTVHRWRRGR